MKKIEQGLTDRFIRLHELKKMIGYSSTSIWRRRRDDSSFPHPVRIGPAAVAYRMSEVEAWMNSRQSVELNSMEVKNEYDNTKK